MITGNYLYRRQYVAGVVTMAAQAGQQLIQDIWQQEMNKRAEQRGLKNSKELMDYQQMKQLEMWEKTGYGPQMEQMRKAGLNPALMYGMGGGGGQTTGNASATASGIPTQSAMSNALGMGMQLKLMEAQKNLIEAQTEKTTAEVPNVQADTQNKILQQIITEYTGKEAKDTYERVTSPNRGIQAKTYQDELEARQGVAGTIYELWNEGKLKDKSLAEIETILLQNAKSREEIRRIYKDIELLEENLKGKKMENVMTELEMRLQKETGIDRNSPTWFKILGRLFVELLNR